MILQELLRIQDQHGYLPRKQMAELAERLAIPLYRVHEVATFFPHFRVFASDAEEVQRKDEVPHYEVSVCRDMACELRGSAEYLSALTEATQSLGHHVVVKGVSCLGRCDRACAVRVHAHEPHQVHALLGRSVEETVAGVKQIVSGRGAEGVPNDTDIGYELPQQPEEWRIDPYRALQRESRYESVRRFIVEAGPNRRGDAERDRVIASLKTAQLLGMGGAGGRAFKKWSEVREATGDKKYVVCNGDESEPGTFKDRELLLRTPHLVVEGVILAGLVVGAERGFIYIRHEYEEAIEAVRQEIEWARNNFLCGRDVLGSGISFEVEVFVSPGGYICGEQTALVQAIQDERAEPRNRPPELQTNGLWNMPTLLNNVETLAWAPAIVLEEGGTGEWYVKQGETGYVGARFFSISGDVARPGVYEVPVGIRLGELIDKYAGGMKDGVALKALALSGPSGGFLPPVLPLESFSPGVRDTIKQFIPAESTAFDLRDLPLDIGVTRKVRIMLGAAIVIYGEQTDIVDQTLACLRFYKAESCGKCVPCRIGSTKLYELCEDLSGGKLTPSDIERLTDRNRSEISALAQAMADTAICGLGTSVPKSIQSLLAHFPQDVSRYLRSQSTP
ncbi:MAG: NADH-ubiquinone oxidoreductase-F iron-sulfur binding region domain-containing protein [Planctomycetota bacterium]